MFSFPCLIAARGNILNYATLTAGIERITNIEGGLKDQPLS